MRYFSCKKKYANEILETFQLHECGKMNNPINQKEKLVKEFRVYT